MTKRVEIKEWSYGVVILDNVPEGTRTKKSGKWHRKSTTKETPTGTVAISNWVRFTTTSAQGQEEFRKNIIFVKTKRYGT